MAANELVLKTLHLVTPSCRSTWTGTTERFVVLSFRKGSVPVWLWNPSVFRFHSKRFLCAIKVFIIVVAMTPKPRILTAAHGNSFLGTVSHTFTSIGSVRGYVCTQSSFKITAVSVCYQTLDCASSSLSVVVLKYVCMHWQTLHFVFPLLITWEFTGDNSLVSNGWGPSIS